MKVTATGWKIFGGLVLLILLLMAWGARQSDPPERVGQHSILRVDGGGQVPVAASVPAFEALTNAAVAHDSVGIAQLMAAGAVAEAPVYRSVEALDLTTGKVDRIYP